MTEQISIQTKLLFAKIVQRLGLPIEDLAEGICPHCGGELYIKVEKKGKQEFIKVHCPYCGFKLELGVEYEECLNER